MDEQEKVWTGEVECLICGWIGKEEELIEKVDKKTAEIIRFCPSCFSTKIDYLD